MYYFGERESLNHNYECTTVFEGEICVPKLFELKKWLVDNTVFIHGLMPLPQNTTREEFEIEMVKKILDI